MKSETRVLACQLKASPIDLPAATEVFENQEWLDANDAARYLGTSLGAVRNMTSNGVLPHYKLGRRVRYRVEELRTLLLQNRRGASLNGN